MYLDGPFVPPPCPVEREGEVYRLSDARFTMHVHDYPGTGQTEIFCSFYGHGQEDNLTTGIISVSSASGIAQQARRFRQSGETIIEGGPRLEALRSTLCDQVSGCHGISKGQCWALGELGLFAAISEVVGQDIKE